MRRFPVPFDLKFEDKIIGGFLSLREAAWIFTPSIIGMLSLLNPSSFIKDGHIQGGKVVFKIVRILIYTGIGAAMALYKKHNLTLDKYLIKSIKHKFSKNSIKHYE